MRFILHTIFFLVSLMYAPFLLRTQVLHNAHAHNDYQRKNPLFSALEHGIPSIEVDVFLHKGEIVVAHHAVGLSLRSSLEDMYLRPLLAYCKERQGQVFNDGSVLVLMFDLKNEKDSLVHSLYSLLQSYKSLIRSPGMTDGTVIIMLSGNPPIETIKTFGLDIFVVDGHSGMLNETTEVDFVPRISMNYRRTFRWRGFGDMCEADIMKLEKLVAQARESGQKLRFWGMPNRRRIWSTFSKYPEVIINIDRYKKFKKFSDNLDSLQSENGHQ